MIKGPFILYLVCGGSCTGVHNFKTHNFELTSKILLYVNYTSIFKNPIRSRHSGKFL